MCETLKLHIKIEHTDEDLMSAYKKLHNVEIPEVVHNFDYEIPEYKGRNINEEEYIKSISNGGFYLFY